MPEYTNRREQTYFLKEGRTKTGKPRYYASMKADDGKNASAMPEGYEFHETVNAQVVVRRVPERHFKEDEIAAVGKALKALETDARFEEKGKSFVIHTANRDISSLESLSLLGMSESMREKLEQQTTYSAMLRFTLVEPKQRLFTVERMRFIGEPDWLLIDGPGTLKKAAKTYVPMLDDEETFFEQI